MAINYANGARLGRDIQADIETEALLNEQQPRLAKKMYYRPGGDVWPLAIDVTTLSGRVGSFLRPRPILVAGIICYVIAGLLDTAAGVGALLR